jgi:transcriptional regulator with XRE-family HTH domain
MTSFAHKLELGGVIRRRRVDRGLSQRDLAQRAEVNQSNVSRFEAGTFEPRLNTLTAIAEALGCTAADLLREADAS